MNLSFSLKHNSLLSLSLFLKCDSLFSLSQITHNTDDIPPAYYLTNLTETSREEMERVVVGRGSVHKIRCEVAEPRSVLKWEFISVDYDIAFGVYHKSDKKLKEQVVGYW